MSELLRFDKTSNFTFIDLETLNLCLNFAQNLPWQVAMIKTTGGAIDAERDLLIKWNTDLRISHEAKVITRYPEDKIRDFGLSFDEVFPQMEEWLEAADYIVGHNTLGFDIYLIKEMYRLNGKKITHLVDKFLDTNCLAKGIKFGIPKMPKETLLEYQYKLLDTRRKGVKTNLTALGKEYKIDVDYENLHQALNDLHLNLMVFNKLKFQIDL